MPGFYYDRDARGIPVELVLLQLCHLRGIPAELNPAPEEDLAGRSAYDLVIAGIPVDVKADWLSWRTNHICVEKEALDHTSAEYFAYALPNGSGLYFHMFLVRELVSLYELRNPIWRDGKQEWGWYVYEHKIVGDQRDNEAVLLPKELTQSVGQPFWLWAKTIKQQAA